MSPFGPSMSIKIITRWVAPTPLVFRNFVLDHTQSSPWFSIDTPKRLWKCSFAGPHHGCCHSNVYRRWDIKPKMWQIWKWLHHPMEEPPQQKPDPTSVGKSDTGFVILSNDWAPGMVLLGHFPPWTILTRQETGWKKQVTWDVSHIHPPWFTHFYESTGFEESTFTLLGKISTHAPNLPLFPANHQRWSKKSGESLQRNQGFQSHQPESALCRNGASSIVCFYINQRTYHLILLCGSASTSSSSSSTI